MPDSAHFILHSPYNPTPNSVPQTICGSDCRPRCLPTVFLNATLGGNKHKPVFGLSPTKVTFPTSEVAAERRILIVWLGHHQQEGCEDNAEQPRSATDP